MDKPTPPLGRMIREGWTKFCPVCHSSLRPWWSSKKGCIQEKCSNYFDK